MKTLIENGTTQILIGLAFAVAVMVPQGAVAALPAVDNASGATNVLSISAALNGTLTSTGGLPTQVYVYWGETNGDTNMSGSWGHTNNLGTNGVGTLSLEVTQLWPNQTYYYRFFATNLDGGAWASATTNFQTQATTGPLPVTLGSTAGFAILAGAEITSTGGGIINGDIGTSPMSGSGIGINAAQVNGTIYAVDDAGPAGSVNDPDLLAAAKGDLTIAYNDAAGRLPAPTGPFLNPGAGNIGGLNLVPGLYKFTGEAHIDGADVTLTGGPNDVWIFQIASALIVGADGRQVILAGGAQAKNIFWQVGTSASIGTFAVFKGTIIADQAITMGASSTMDGRALASHAGVTYNGDSGSLPTAPAAPRFTNISVTVGNSVTVDLSTTPYFSLTLETNPNLATTNWTAIATDNPVVSEHTFIDNTAMSAGETQRFYRAFLTY